MKKFKDKYHREINHGDNLLFQLEDKIEPSGFNKFVRTVEMCYWDRVSKKYIPISEEAQESDDKDVFIITTCEIIQ